MIPLAKLARLHPRHRLRKAALVLSEVERRLRAPYPLAGQEADRAAAESYAAALCAYLAADADCPGELRARAGRAAEAAAALAAALAAAPAAAAQARSIDAAASAPARAGDGRVACAEAGGGERARAALVRAVDELRHALLRETGQAPADWDLLDPATGRPDAAARRVRPGMRAYLEDLRSPFNVGSIFRTADAFGLEELLLSPDTADPAHPRSARSSMGATALVPWRRAGLEALGGTSACPSAEGSAATGGPAEGVFALELGGVPLDEFDFPERGIVVVGSEELGVSPAALERCGAGRVSIPMVGAKGSLNAGVAFGILLCAWSRSLERRS